MNAATVARNVTLKAVPAAALALLLAGDAVAADRYSVLYDFCSLSGCADGAGPVSILSDAAGKVFGTAYPGGANNLGTVFELARNRAGGFSETVIYSFCSRTNCSDGSLPAGSLIRDTNGNLYGVTDEGGAFGAGEVYELTHSHGQWTLKILYSFCAQTNCSDGKFPAAGLTYAGAGAGTPYDGTSPLFGTAGSGGAGGWGTVFELRHGRDGWTEKTLYSFCALSACSDGASPAATLAIDASGNIYGTTDVGGGPGSGVVFELSRSGGLWTETVLHAFCAENNCTDGALPLFGGVVMGPSGTLFGATNAGGISCADRDHGPCGVIYSLVPEGVNSTFTVLYSFGQGGRSDDGANPTGTPVLDAAGDLIGITEFGGTGRGGVAYKLAGSKLKVLHAFCATSGDGCDPTSAYLDAKGRLYGTTGLGGTGNDSSGTAFVIR